jgi:hypothetical protein
MARRVFFSFHYDRDVWRANQVRNCNVVAGTDIAGFFDHSEYEEAKKKGREGIERMINRNLRNTSVTVILTGKETARRPWVRYEIRKSIEQDNGLLGIRIHHLKNQDSESDWWPGPAPDIPADVEFPIYDWDRDLDRFRKAIEAAGKRSDGLRGVY